jgi:hypothetical protein
MLLRDFAPTCTAADPCHGAGVLPTLSWSLKSPVLSPSVHPFLCRFMSIFSSSSLLR